MTKTPETLTIDETESLLCYLASRQNTFNQVRTAARNYAMALLMLDAGLRVGEVVHLERNNLAVFGRPANNVVIPKHITKTKRGRDVPMTDRLKKAINSMIKLWWNEDGIVLTGYAFYKKNPEQPLSARQVERILGSAGSAAIGRWIHPHQLRHTFASRLMKRANIRIVQTLLGHQSISSTQIYTHPDAEDLQKAINGGPVK